MANAEVRLYSNYSQITVCYRTLSRTGVLKPLQRFHVILLDFARVGNFVRAEELEQAAVVQANNRARFVAQCP